MSIQAHFDNQAISMLPRVKSLILQAREAGDYDEANQMYSKTINAALNSKIPLENMTGRELSRFQMGLIDIFHFHGWF